MSELLRLNRVVKTWAYDVSHSRLLLRATKTSREPTQVDVLFKNVQSVHMAEMTMERLVVREASFGLREKVLAECRPEFPEERVCFELISPR